MEISASSLESALASALQKVYFCLQKIVFGRKNKKEYLGFSFCSVMPSVPLCYKYLFLYNFLLIHPKEFIGVLEKSCLNFRKHPSIGISKSWLLRNFLHTSHQNIQGGVRFKYTRRPSWDFHKKSFRAAFLWRTC